MDQHRNNLQLLHEVHQALQQGHTHRAEQKIQNILKKAPGFTPALMQAALMALQKNQPERARTFLNRITASERQCADWSYLMGTAFHLQNRHAEALTHLRTALRFQPDLVPALNNCGATLRALGKSEEALQCYDRAWMLQPGLAEIAMNRGQILLERRQYDTALTALREATRLNPNLAQAWQNLAQAAHDQHLYEEASSAYQHALDLGVCTLPLLNDYGLALRALKRFDQARIILGKATELDPNSPAPWSNLALTLQDSNDPDAALTAFARAQQLAADYVDGHYLNLLASVADWDGFIPQNERVQRRLLQGDLKISAPFTLLAHCANPRILLEQNRAYCRTFPKDDHIAFEVDFKPRDTHRLRLGYLSSDLGEHAVSALMSGVWREHDRERIEVHAISLHHRPDDSLQQQLRQQFEFFHDWGTQDDHCLTEQIRSLQLDILIDLNGHTKNARTTIVARRLAPIQIQYLGYPASMGGAAIDYIIGDPVVTPLQHAPHYHEKILQLPVCFQANDDCRPIGPPTQRREHGLPEQGLVLACFCNSYKITPTLWQAWCQILHNVPESCLWLLCESPRQAINLRHHFAAAQLAEDRLVLADRKPYADHLARLRLADLILDTFPFGGGTTSSDALWAGTPLLTLQGDTYAGRMSASLLHACGLDALITESIDAYISTAIQLCQNPQSLTAIRQHLKNPGQLPPFQTQTFTRTFEQTLIALWQNQLPTQKLCTDEQPPHNRSVSPQ